MAPKEDDLMRKTQEQREAETTEAHERLTAAVEGLMSEGGWKAMIESRRWLSKYSLNNLLMIMVQCPGATDVRPYGAKVNPSPNSWKAVGRYARRGEHAIKIFAPSFRNGKDEQGEDEKRLIGFRLVPVFDVSQTDGEPLPPAADVRPELLTGDAPAWLWENTVKLIEKEGYTIERGDCGGPNGWTNFMTRIVRVRADVEPLQAAKTLIHELAHIRCDHENRPVGRDMQETEAESVACIVMDAAGLVSLPYSVPYVTGWAQDAEIVHKSANTVLKVADEIKSDLGI